MRFASFSLFCFLVFFAFGCVAQEALLQDANASLADANAALDLNAGADLNFVYILDFNINAESFSKGDTIEIEGASRRNVTITALNEGRRVFSEEAEVVNRKFSFSYETGFLDPSGQWRITVSDGNRTKTKKISVSQTRESAFLAITFLSPTPIAFRRTESVNVVLRVTDVGQAVGDAQVFFWGLDGNKIFVPHQEEGIYSYVHRIPEYAETGQLELKAVSSLRKLKETVGGESTMTITIVPSPLEMKLVDPITRNFSFGGFLNLKLRFLYADGTRMADGNVSAIVTQGVKAQEFSMQPASDGYFFAAIPTEGLENRVLNITVEAEDPSGNSTVQFLQLEPHGYLSYFLQKNALFFAIPTIFLVALVAFWYRKSKRYLGKKRLLKEKARLLALKKKNQKNYLVDRSVSRKVFDERAAELEMKLRQVESALAETQKQGGKGKGSA